VLCNLESEHVPEGFFTCKQWSAKLNFCKSHVRRRLLDGVKAGKIEIQMFRVRIGKVTRKEAHYRILV
jgi:hypothetical protein